MTERSMRTPLQVLAAAAVLALAGPPQAQAESPASRGQLLYANHCVECHSTQMHWRDKRLATDWASLQAWVRRWQAEASLQWSDEDIDAVARHLNDTIYQFPQRQAAR